MKEATRQPIEMRLFLGGFFLPWKGGYVPLSKPSDILPMVMLVPAARTWRQGLLNDQGDCLRRIDVVTSGSGCCAAGGIE